MKQRRNRTHLLNIGRCNHLLASLHPRPQDSWIIRNRVRPHNRTPSLSLQDQKSKVSWLRSSSVQTNKKKKKDTL